MHITVDMVFRKNYVLKFIKTLSVSSNTSIIEFEQSDKFNSIIRSYLVKPPKNYKPLHAPEVTKILVPLLNSERNYLSYRYLPKKEWKNLESDFEDMFFRLFYEIEIASGMVPNKRKASRIKFLNMCGITDDVMNEDSFRKSFDRFLEKKTAKINELLSKRTLTIANIYKSAI